MAYKINVLKRAEKDIREIVYYIKNELNNSAAAARQYDLIEAAIERAANNPYMYPVYYPMEKLKHDYRKIPVGRYLVFYWVDEDAKTIMISRVLFSRRNYQTNDGGGSYLCEPPMKWKFDTIKK